MILILQIVIGVAVGVFLGQLALTTFSFYMQRHFAKKRARIAADAMAVLDEVTQKIKASAPQEAPKEEKRDVGQYL